MQDKIFKQVFIMNNVYFNLNGNAKGGLMKTPGQLTQKDIIIFLVFKKTGAKMRFE